MDLSAYLLNGVIAATAPPGETLADAQSRAAAIAAMLRAYAPGDGMEAMLACQCVMLQFLLTAAMRDASNPHQEPAVLAKARAAAISASRALHQWVTKFENTRKRNELRAAEAAKVQSAAARSAAEPTAQTPPAAQSAESLPDRSGPRSPVPNGRVAAAGSLPDPLLAAAVRTALSNQAFSGSAASPLSLPAEASQAA
jgi:hypothetical protein